MANLALHHHVGVLASKASIPAKSLLLLLVVKRVASHLAVGQVSLSSLVRVKWVVIAELRSRLPRLCALISCNAMSISRRLEATRLDIQESRATLALIIGRKLLVLSGQHYKI